MAGSLKDRSRPDRGPGSGGVLVQEMVTGGVECMIGVKRDPVFGPLVAVGLGGIYVEVLKDLSLSTPLWTGRRLEE